MRVRMLNAFLKFLLRVFSLPSLILRLPDHRNARLTPARYAAIRGETTFTHSIIIIESQLYPMAKLKHIKNKLHKI